MKDEIGGWEPGARGRQCADGCCGRSLLDTRHSTLGPTGHQCVNGCCGRSPLNPQPSPLGPTGRQRVESGDGIRRQLTKRGRELDLAPALALRVEHRAGGDGPAEHFLEAKRLGAELRIVVLKPAAPAPP